MPGGSFRSPRAKYDDGDGLQFDDDRAQWLCGKRVAGSPREVLKSCSTPTLMGILGGDFVLFPWRGQILDGLLHVLFDGFVECFPVACLQQIQ